MNAQGRTALFGSDLLLVELSKFSFLEKIQDPGSPGFKDETMVVRFLLGFQGVFYEGRSQEGLMTGIKNGQILTPQHAGVSRQVV